MALGIPLPPSPAHPPTSMAAPDSIQPDGAPDDTPKKKLVTRSYRELPTSVFNAWDTVSLVRETLTIHELGQFQGSAYLVDAMGRDARISGILQARIDGLMSKPVDFKTGEGHGRRQKIAKKAQDTWVDMADEAELKQLLKWGLMLGFAVAEKVWETKDGKWTPRLQVWHPAFVYWRWDTRSYWLTTAEGPVEIPEGGDSKWLIYTPYGYKRGWMEGKVRALAIPWLMRGWALRDWARFSELYALGMILARVPNGTDPKDRNRFVNGVSNRAQEPVIECPFDPMQGPESGYNIEVVDTGGASTAWEVIPGLADRAETDISIAILGQNLTTEVKQGSRAAAQVHQSVKQELVQSDSTTLGRTLQKQLLEPWAEFNFGRGDLAPLPSWQVEPPEDKDKTSGALQKLGAFLQSAKATGSPVNTRVLLEQQGVPLLTEEEEAQQKAEAAETAQSDGPQPGDVPEDDQDEPGPPAKLSSRQPKGGQVYVDQVARAATKHGTRAVELDLASVIQQVQSASSPDDLKVRLLRLYPHLDPSELAAVIERADLLAAMAGRAEVIGGG